MIKTCLVRIAPYTASLTVLCSHKCDLSGTMYANSTFSVLRLDPFLAIDNSCGVFPLGETPLPVFQPGDE